MKRSPCHICQKWFYTWELSNFDTCKNCMGSIRHNKKINHPQPLYNLGSIELV